MSHANSPFRFFSLAAFLVAAILLLNIPVDGAPLSTPTSRPQSSTGTRIGAATASATRGGSRTRTSSAAGAIHTTTANATTTNVACTRPANRHGSKGRGRALDSRCATPDESDPAFAFHANKDKCPDVKQVEQYITLWIQQELGDAEDVVVVYWTFPTTQKQAEAFSVAINNDEENDGSRAALQYGDIMEDGEFTKAWIKACGTKKAGTDQVKVASAGLASATPGEAIFLIDSSKKETPDGRASIEWEETELPILRRKRTKIIVHDLATKKEVTWEEYEKQKKAAAGSR